MTIPIVMAAFGTTTGAMKTYSHIHDICLEKFQDHPIRWAFSSRTVKARFEENQDFHIRHPREVLRELAADGYRWAVVQSLHLMWGHEFYRLTEEIKDCGLRTSVGLPLLTDPSDYLAVIDIFKRIHPRREEEAVILVGHGTDHPGWSMYVALDYLLQVQNVRGIYVGVVEKEGLPERSTVIRNIRNAGYERVRILPFLLVSGMHFREDLTGDGDSWRTACEEQGISVSVENQGIGYRPEIVDLYCRHVRAALDVIPLSVRGNASGPSAVPMK